MQLVAVYGSLKQGFGNNRLLGDSPLLGTTLTEPKYTLYSMGAFPCVAPHGDTAVTVEVYEVESRVFSRLDMLEGYPTFYNRKQIDTEYGQAWMYYIDGVRDIDQVIESGVW